MAEEHVEFVKPDLDPNCLRRLSADDKASKESNRNH